MRKNLQHVRVGDKVKTGEQLPLPFQIGLQQFLALLQSLLHVGEVILEQV